MINNRRIYNLNNNTFNDTQPAKYLVTKLKEPEYTQYTKAVTSILGESFQFSKALFDIEDTTISRWALAQWKLHSLKWIEDRQFPKDIKSNMDNIIITRYRQYIRQLNERQKIRLTIKEVT